MKDASLILIFFALLAYINGHEYLFVFILLALSKFLGKKEKKILHQEPIQETTIDTDIEIDDNITIDEQEDQELEQEQNQEQLSEQK
jgi:hypothetical protein